MVAVLKVARCKVIGIFPPAIGIQNPSSTSKEARSQYLECGIYSVEFRIQALNSEFHAKVIIWQAKCSNIQFILLYM